LSVRFQADNDLKRIIVDATLRREPRIDFQTAQAAPPDRMISTNRIRDNVIRAYPMIRDAKDLSPDQKTVIESLLGRRVLEGEAISVRAIEPPALSDERRTEFLRGLEEYFAQVDRQRQPASPEEVDAIIDEALRSTRPNYRPVR
jgi:hypothetical protein